MFAPTLLPVSWKCFPGQAGHGSSLPLPSGRRGLALVGYAIFLVLLPGASAAQSPAKPTLAGQVTAVASISRLWPMQVLPAVGLMPAEEPSPEIGPMECDCERTGVQTDLAIVGEGYFLTMERSAGWDRFRLVRQGGFRLNEEGYLVSVQGGRLQAFDPSGRQREDLRIFAESPAQPNPATRWFSGYTIDARGSVLAQFSDGTSNVLARLGLWFPENPGRLTRVSEWEWEDSDAFDSMATAFRPLPDVAGRIINGYLERPRPGIRVTPIASNPRSQGAPASLRVGIEGMLHLEGPGFLAVRDPASGRRYVTRCGALKWDRDGWLVTVLRGYRVQGYAEREAKDLADLRCDAPLPTHDPADPGAWLHSVEIGLDGRLEQRWSDGSSTHDSRIAILTFRRPARLADAGDFFFEETPDALRITNGEPGVRTVLHHGAVDPRFVIPEIRAHVQRSSSFQQHAIQRVERADALAITGAGFFIVRDPQSNRYAVTRLGEFEWTAEGTLETRPGWRIQGVAIEESGQPRDIEIPRSALADSEARIVVDREGQVWVSLGTGEARVVSRVILARMRDPTTLNPIGALGYDWPHAEPPGPDSGLRWGYPGSNGLGSIQMGALELLFDSGEDLPSLDGRQGTQVDLFGMQERTAVVERSDDLVSWKPWASFSGGRQGFDLNESWTLPDGALRFGQSVFDMNGDAGTGRFYRLRILDSTNRGDVYSP